MYNIQCYRSSSIAIEKELIMAKAEFEGYGGKEDFLPCKTGPGKTFNDKSGGDIDAFGDWEKKEKDAIDMNAGEAFNKKDYTKVEAMGTDYPKKSGKPGQFSDNKDDHFKVEMVDPYGNSEAKSQSYQTVKRK